MTAISKQGRTHCWGLYCQTRRVDTDRGKTRIENSQILVRTNSNGKACWPGSKRNSIEQSRCNRSHGLMLRPVTVACRFIEDIASIQSSWPISARTSVERSSVVLMKKSAHRNLPTKREAPSEPPTLTTALNCGQNQVFVLEGHLQASPSLLTFFS